MKRYPLSALVSAREAKVRQTEAELAKARKRLQQHERELDAAKLKQARAERELAEAREQERQRLATQGVSVAELQILANYTRGAEHKVSALEKHTQTCQRTLASAKRKEQQQLKMLQNAQVEQSVVEKHREAFERQQRDAQIARQEEEAAEVHNARGFR